MKNEFKILVPKVLFIDDDVIFLAGIKNFFSEFQIFSAYTKKEALAILNTENIDAIISDINLPDGSGFEVFLSSSLEKPEIFKIAISSLNFEEAQVCAQKIGATFDFYFKKPLFPETLNKIKENILKGIFQNAK